MANKKDVVFTSEDNIKFNFKVEGIFVNDGKILLQKAEGDGFYCSLGGRVNFGEDTKSALVREVYEETGVKLDINDLCLVDVVENFFTYRDTKYHEILFIYKVNDNKELNYMDNFVTKDTGKNINKWVEIKKLNEIEVLPKVIVDKINSSTMDHNIIKDMSL